MDVTTLYSIGELSRRTGLSVRTIRFYSDSGVVAPTTRSPAGYRLYDLDALLRLELLRTLRELGMDLPTIQRVLDRELSMAEVAAAHADAMDVPIRMLQLRRSVLRVVASRGCRQLVINGCGDVDEFWTALLTAEPVARPRRVRGRHEILDHACD